MPVIGSISNQQLPHVIPEVTAEDEVTVLVTGFGPFLDKYPINASWSIAATLPDTISANAAHPTRINIIVPKDPIRVAFQEVLNRDPGLLSSTQPKIDIVLHIGLAAGIDYYTIERLARREGYDDEGRCDVDGKSFTRKDSRKVWYDCPDYLTTGFDYADVWRRWRSNCPDPKLDLQPSDDAGLYLCEFIYFTSLSYFWRQGVTDRPVMFLHVPDLPGEKDIAEGREVAIALIRALVDSWRQRSKKIEVNGAVTGETLPTVAVLP
ncbi:peptidase C15, pyroglutamyl peptidase I-like protein [Patellaria atrata CBS 101060]|uniref:Peptidase C15, pyroglutamyl peptidase I-like protein n=1 Tax=Patellaria atrata CBS 101060 TaxID=1346257 RepID=A0A9P4VK07_9PEZI|nr:peptidase C15, pyroglutamyl peptidase I-like protein [Patellaria atrata CBS 101060]